jgi:hypothetical protein
MRAGPTTCTKKPRAGPARGFFFNRPIVAGLLPEQERRWPVPRYEARLVLSPPSPECALTHLRPAPSPSLAAGSFWASGRPTSRTRLRLYGQRQPQTRCPPAKVAGLAMVDTAEMSFRDIGRAPETHLSRARLGLATLLPPAAASSAALTGLRPATRRSHILSAQMRQRTLGGSTTARLTYETLEQQINVIASWICDRGFKD